MVFNSVSETETPPLNPPPSSPPPPPPPPINSSIFSATKPQPHHHYTNFRWPMSHSNRNLLRPIPEDHHQPLSPLHYPQSPNRKAGDWGLRLGPAGFRLGDSGLNNPGPRMGSEGLGPNPVLRLGSSPPNPAGKNNGLGDSKREEPVSEKGGRTPVEPVDGSEKKVDEKGKAKITFRFPEMNKGSGYVTDDSDEVEAEGEEEEARGEGDEGEGEGEVEGDTDEAEAELSFEDEEEEPNFMKNWSQKEDGDEKKTWNLRPRNLVTKQPPRNVNNGGGPRGGVGRSGQGSKTKLEQASSRSRAAAAAPGVATQLKKLKFSLALTKEEIEEDFLKLTGAKPPKKPKRRPKHVQRQLDACFPGLYLHSVNPEMYRVPDPPLKR